MSAVGKSHLDSATMHDVIGNHGGTREQKSVHKNFGGRTRSQIVQQLVFLAFLKSQKYNRQSILLMEHRRTSAHQL